MQLLLNQTDIMHRVQSCQMRASLGTLGKCLKFSIPYDVTASPIPDAEPGAAVRLYDEENVYTPFTGILTACKHTETAREYTAYDFCYYLNKSQICIQFAEMRTDRAIAQLWDKLGIRRVNLPRMQGVISAITYVKTPSEILRTLLDFEQDVSGVEYYAVANGYRSIDIQPVGYYPTRLELRQVSSPMLSLSLDGVRNRIYYAIRSDDTVNLTAEAADEASIARYGQISEYIIDSAEPVYTAQIAQARLARKHLPLQTGEITALGNWRAEIGRRITVEDAVTDLRGAYIIESVVHSVSDGLHLMTLGLGQRAAG